MRQLVGVLGERGAPQANPEHGDAFRRMFVIRAIVWLQQSRTMHDVQARDYDAGLSADRAIGRLADARTAGLHTDPLDREALALRGYVAKTLAGPAQVLPGGGAVFRARLFEHVFSSTSCSWSRDTPRPTTTWRWRSRPRCRLTPRTPTNGASGRSRRGRGPTSWPRTTPASPQTPSWPSGSVSRG
ncbi:MAG TPA: hypothetical protein VMY40_03630 [Anaerolineae bacterium]|nr:hypothetical protein [Anaerolineae bacterium]